MTSRGDSRLTSLLLNFYTTPRLGQERLSDGGGPFGFDITTAFQIDYLIELYECDGIVETGAHMGDTTAYLARQYSHLPILSCDIVDYYVRFTQQRLANLGNATVLQGDSAFVLPDLLQGLKRPLVYLDAHWQDQWPLRDELAAVKSGVVAVDDFDIGHSRFGFDHYDGEECGPRLLAKALPDADEVFVGNPYASYPAPCLQTGRRSGTGYLARTLDTGPLARSNLFVRVPLRPAITMPSWGSAGLRLSRPPVEVSSR
ncbi:hypothetical protein [Streptomyces tsukubensis]|uniref:hypothetical protein n=1 Tax=Streptomyces tsukubensis TaxID=83656 RepID=UPI00344F7E1F